MYLQTREDLYQFFVKLLFSCKPGKTCNRINTLLISIWRIPTLPFVLRFGLDNRFNFLS